MRRIFSNRPRLEYATLKAQLCIIRGAFASYMSQVGYPQSTSRLYQNSLERVAIWLAGRGQSIMAITGQDVAAILHDYFFRRWRCITKTRHRAALHAWLRFRGRPRASHVPLCRAAWFPWVQDYDRFLAGSGGLSTHTRIYRRRYATLFLAECFGDGRPHWARIGPQDILRFAERFVARVKPSSANLMLGSLRSFLRFTHLRGVCGPGLAKAVPIVANYGQSVRPTILSEAQRRRLSRSFPARHPASRRDRAITLCLLELGLRASDVAHLRVDDFDHVRATLNVFSPKTGHRRLLPLTRDLADAIEDYLRRGRTESSSGQLFLRIMPPTDRPMGTEVVRGLVRRAYSRCGLPPAWTGTHRLRHGFATRLYARGATLAQIASLLGHRCLESSNRYTQTDLQSLRALAQPWPK